jgi:hypothetical protein
MLGNKHYNNAVVQCFTTQVRRQVGLLCVSERWEQINMSVNSELEQSQ